MPWISTCSRVPAACGVIGLAFALMTGVQRAAAGPVLMPMAPELDLASNVVVGKITQITPVEENRGPGSHGGRATVEVEETLKGEPAKTIQFLVLTGADAEFQEHCQEHIQEYKVGDRGIWVIGSGWANDGGAIPDAQKEEIKKVLTDLKNRKWSEPVNGLRAWAAVVQPDYLPNPGIIFAVTNASNVDLWVPHEIENGFVRATVADEQSNVFGLILRAGKSPIKQMYCHQLRPGKILYLHPDGFGGFIDLARFQHLAPGKYSVVISCKNERADGESVGAAAGLNAPVVAWQGEVSTPAVDLEIKPPGQPGNVPPPPTPATAP